MNDFYRLGDELGNDFLGFWRGIWVERNFGVRLKEGDSLRMLWFVKVMVFFDVVSLVVVIVIFLFFDVL